MENEIKLSKEQRKILVQALKAGEITIEEGEIITTDLFVVTLTHEQIEILLALL